LSSSSEESPAPLEDRKTVERAIRRWRGGRARLASFELPPLVPFE
jgi:hypothetical protein